MLVNSRLNLNSQPFERISDVYERVNFLMSLGLVKVWRRQVIKALEIKNGGKVLDIGCGAGDLLELIDNCSVSKIGLDPEAVMLLKARQPFHRLRAAAESIPLKASRVDCAMSAWALRNFSNRQSAFEQIFTILKPGGHCVITEFSPLRAGIFNLFINLYIRFGIHWLGGLLSGDYGAYAYLAETIHNFPQPEIIQTELQVIGFTNVTFRRLIGGASVLYICEKPEAR